MLLLSLNIRHGGAGRVDAIVEYIGSQAADVIVLTEFRNGESGDALRTRLRSFGYIYEFCPTTLVGVNTVLVASRTTAAAIDLAPPQSEIHRIIGGRLGAGQAINALEKSVAPRLRGSKSRKFLQFQ